jgi:5-formyltetrahydrofolate cyclo-ligase
VPTGNLLYAGVADAPDILERKRALRERIKTWRAGLGAEAQREAAEALAQHGLGFLPPVAPGKIVSGFAPIADELRLWPLLRRLAADGYRLALPVMQGKDKPLIFRAWSAGDVMDKGVWNIAEPKADKPALEPDIVLVPLLAFDAAGWRLGYGGGYYDRTLKNLRSRKTIVAVGVAHDEQCVEAVPRFHYDERLDWVLTPSGPLRCVG